MDKKKKENYECPKTEAFGAEYEGINRPVLPGNNTRRCQPADGAELQA